MEGGVSKIEKDELLMRIFEHIGGRKKKGRKTSLSLIGSCSPSSTTRRVVEAGGKGERKGILWWKISGQLDDGTCS